MDNICKKEGNLIQKASLCWYKSSIDDLLMPTSKKEFSVRICNKVILLETMQYTREISQVDIWDRSALKTIESGIIGLPLITNNYK